MDIDIFLAGNFAPIFAFIILSVMLVNNNTISDRIKLIFKILLVVEFVELAAYNFELWTATWSEPSLLRILLSAIGYTVRPLIVFLIIQINNRNRSNKYNNLILMIPIFVNTLVSFSAFFTDIAYSYDQLNEFHRGPLGYSSQIVTVGYLIILIIYAFNNNHKERMNSTTNRFELVVLSLSTIYISTAMIIEALYNIRSIGRSAVVLSTLFYYMFFQTKQFHDNVEKIQTTANEKIVLDELTGLYNKHGFIANVKKNIANLTGESCSILFIDIDDFKLINDQAGHLEGDQILKELAYELRSIFREIDIIGRFGGDEFCVFVQDITAEKLEERLKQLKEAITTRKYGVQNISLTISVGSVCFTTEQTSEINDLLNIADKILYSVKEKGKNGYEIKQLNN